MAISAPVAALQLVVVLLNNGLAADAFTEELFTTNAVCKQRFCINPVFPAYAALPELESKRWVKQNLTLVYPFMEFCGSFVNYDPAVPMNVTESSTEPRLVSHSDDQESTARSDRAAAEMFFAHLSGMGLEAWDHADPWAKSSSPLQPCAESVARMSCLTYFPEAPVFALIGQEVGYMRPCSAFCESYLQACEVECCDESVSCVFDRSASTLISITDKGAASESSTATLLSKRKGYVDSSAPTALCSGSAMARKAAAERVSLLEKMLGKSGASRVEGRTTTTLLFTAMVAAIAHASAQ